MDCKSYSKAGILADKALYGFTTVRCPSYTSIYTPSRFIRPRRLAELKRQSPMSLWSSQLTQSKLNCERILDAPGLQKNFSLNTMDLNDAEILGIALSERVFLWTAGSTQELPLSSGIVSSLCWRADTLAVAKAPRSVRLYDSNTLLCSRQLSVGRGFISSMASQDSLLACGSETGKLYFVDVRVRRCKVLKPSAHSDTIAGMKWSPDGSWLATTGLDHKLKIWEVRGSGCVTTWDLDGPAKAVAWATHQRGLLAGGSSVLKSFSVVEDSVQQTQPKGSLIGGLSWQTDSLVAGVGSKLELLDSSLVVRHSMEAHAGGCLQVCEGGGVYSMGGEEAVKVWQHI